LADQATQAFEESREQTRAFLNAASTEEIIFTKGTTESINLVASSWGRQKLKFGDEVLITELEHHANIVPWQIICEQTGAKLVVAPVDAVGNVLLVELQKLLSARTKLVAVSHCSNTLGTINDVKSIVALAKSVGATTLVDGAQIVTFSKVDVQEIDCDFYVFSAHKIFGAYGVGILYGRKSKLEEMPPYQGGGSMIDEVTFEKTTYQDLPFKFEAGTPNISGVIALKPALQYIERIGWDNIQSHEIKILNYATEQITKIPQVQIIGQAKHKAPILSFVLQGAHPSDVGQILDQENIACRTGHHCTQPLMKKFKIPGTVRASFSIFNTEQDVDALISALSKAKEMLL
jgi:cysteine desulfurase/selenocysteine lyase